MINQSSINQSPSKDSTIGEASSIILQKSQRSKRIRFKRQTSENSKLLDFSLQKTQQITQQQTFLSSESKFNGPINILTRLYFKMAQASQVKSYHNESEGPSFCESQLQSRVQDLLAKLQKKSGLIKYLQRKCGNHILKTTKKYQDRIVELENQIKMLKRTNQFMLKATPKNLSFQLPNDFLNSEVQPFKLPKTKYSYQDLFKLTESQLIEVILTQAEQIQRIYKKQQKVQSKSNSIKKLSKQKSARKKHSSLVSHTKFSIKESNQNLNQLNQTSALKERLNLNLISPFNQIDKKQLTPIVKQRVSAQKADASIQTGLLLLEQMNLQTDQSFKDIEKYELDILDLRIQNQMLSKQIQVLKKQNEKQQHQMQQYNEKLKNYCQQLNLQVFSPVKITLPELQAAHPLQNQQQPKPQQKQIQQKPSQVTQVPAQSILGLESMQSYAEPKTTYIQQNYIQILHIFGIQIKQPNYMQEEHQILIYEICNMKKQISKLLKQFKKLEKQLNQSFSRNDWLEGNLRSEQSRSKSLQQHLLNMMRLLQDTNEHVMQLRHKEMHDRLLNKYNDLEHLKIQQQFFPKENKQMHENRIQQEQIKMQVSKIDSLGKIELQNRPTRQQLQEFEQMLLGNHTDTPEDQRQSIGEYMNSLQFIQECCPASE